MVLASGARHQRRRPTEPGRYGKAPSHSPGKRGKRECHEEAEADDKERGRINGEDSQSAAEDDGVVRTPIRVTRAK